MPVEISDTEFVNSFLKAARERKLSAVVAYGTVEGGKAKLKLVSNAGPGPTQGLLGWLQGQKVSAEQLAEGNDDNSKVS